MFQTLKELSTLKSFVADLLMQRLSIQCTLRCNTVHWALIRLVLTETRWRIVPTLFYTFVCSKMGLYCFHRRSAVARSVCHALGVLACAQGKCFEAYGVHFVPLLFKVLAISVQASVLESFISSLQKTFLSYDFHFSLVPRPSMPIVIFYLVTDEPSVPHAGGRSPC